MLRFLSRTASALMKEMECICTFTLAHVGDAIFEAITTTDW